MSANLLELKNICMQFGGLKAVDKLCFGIPQGQLAGLIGPNGAGKTTVFNILTGVYKPTSGQVLFNEKIISGLPPHHISCLGISRTFQNIRLFRELSVLQNILIACHQKTNYGIVDSLLKTNSYLTEEKQNLEKAMSLLKIFNLEKKAHELSSSLPYGDQRKLEIIRALATEPKLLLLDEPAAGMNHSETHALMHTIDQIRNNFKLTVLLIEHDMKLVMGICENIVVLDYGVKIEEGKPDKIQNSKKVIEAYLGIEEQA